MAQKTQTITLWHYALFLFMAIFTLSGIWFLVSPIIARSYVLGRIVETLGLYPFLFPDQFAYFSQPMKPGERLDFLSIYIDSIPFGFFCFLTIIMLGWYARDRAKNDHLHAFIKSKKAIGPHDLMRKMATLFPHNQFYVDYDLHRYCVDGRGPARMTYTALEFMIENGAINLAKTSDINREGDNFLIDRTRMRAALIAPFGDRNPFLGKDLTNKQAVIAAVDQLPWYAAILLYACFARHNALVGGSSKQFVDTIAHVDKFMNDVWRELNDHKRKLGEKLTLGPYELDPDASDSGIAAMLDDGEMKKKAKPKKATPKSPQKDQYIFKDYMAEHGPNFSVTKRARKDLLKILSEPATDRNDRTRTTLNDFGAVLHRHAYLFGALASALQQGRRGGIFPPALFSWLRFVNLEIWNFLLYVDVPKPAAEAAGMFEHWITEKTMREASITPIISERTIDSIIAEVRKYTPKTLVSTNLQEQAREMHRQADIALKLVSDKEDAAERAAREDEKNPA